MSRYLKEQTPVFSVKYPTLYNVNWLNQSQYLNAMRRLKMNRNTTVKLSRNRCYSYPLC